MHRRPRVLFTASVLALGITLSGCESFDPDNAFNFLDPKKPLPGERKPVFPAGVPGVPQGVPPDLVKGYQPPPEQPLQLVETPPEEPKPQARPKPKPRPKQVAAPARPASAPAPPASQAPWPAPRAPTAQPAPWPDSPPPPAQQAPWPAPQPATSQPAPAQTQSPFPDPPPPGSFSR